MSGVRAERRYPLRVGETYQLRYNSAQHWFYFPEMTRNEVLVFKVYDRSASALSLPPSCPYACARSNPG